MSSKNNRGQAIIVNAFMILVVALCLFPVLWMCFISVKSVGEKISGFAALTIEHATLANFARLFELIPVWTNHEGALRKRQKESRRKRGC